MHSCPIYITNKRNRSQPNYVIGDDSSAIIKIISEFGLSKLQLSSMFENSVRVFILSPHYVVCNYSEIPLTIWAFCILQKEKKTLHMPTDNDNMGTFVVPNQKKKERSGFVLYYSRNEYVLNLNVLLLSFFCSARGTGITTFFNLSYNKTDTNFNKLFNYFVAVRVDDFEYSIPIPLNRPINRLSFCIPRKHDYVR